MTDSEKLDLLLSEMQGMKSELQDMKKRVDKMTFSQSEIQKEMYVLNRKLTDTYDVALDALSSSAENRTWHEKGVIA